MQLASLVWLAIPCRGSDVLATCTSKYSLSICPDVQLLRARQFTSKGLQLHEEANIAKSEVSYKTSLIGPQRLLTTGDAKWGQTKTHLLLRGGDKGRRWRSYRDSLNGDTRLLGGDTLLLL